MTRLGAGVAILLGAGMIVLGVAMLRHAHESASWPSTQGEIAEVRVQFHFATNGGSHYAPLMVYRYDVDGAVFENTLAEYGRGSRGEGFFQSEADAAEYGAAIYPIGAPVTVYYDPNAPERSVRAPGAGWASYAPLAMGLGFWALAWFAWRRREAVPRAGGDGDGDKQDL